MMVYDNITRRNMRFCILLNEDELEFLRVGMGELLNTIKSVGGEITTQERVRDIIEKLEHPTVKARPGEALPT